MAGFWDIALLRSIASREALELISLIKMGSDMGITPEISVEEWNNLVLGVQPNHVQMYAGKELSPEERDVFRATFLRERIKAIENREIIRGEKVCGNFLRNEQEE